MRRWSRRQRRRRQRKRRRVQERKQPAPAEGRLGVLLVGLGAVATTFIAGVEAVRRGDARPIGSTTQMAHIRLGQRTEGRQPLIKDFVPLTALEDLVFGAWDPIPDDAYQSAKVAGVLQAEHIEPYKDFLSSIKPMPAVFDPEYVKRLSGENVKKGKNKYELGMQLREDIRRFKKEHDCARLVIVWCASTEIFMRASDMHTSLEKFEQAMREDAHDIAPSMVYAWAALQEGVPFANGAPNLTVDFPALVQLAKEKGVPVSGKDFKTGQTLMKT